MKKLFILSLFLAPSMFLMGQTVTKSNITDKVLLIGISDKISGATYDGLFKAHLSCREHQVALVAGKGFVSTYYMISGANGSVIKTGKFIKKEAGEFDIVDLGTTPDQYTIVFSTSPLIACK